MRSFAPRAQADLDEIVDWLLDHGSTAKTAEDLLTAVLDAAERLSKRPLLGRCRPDILPDVFRFWSLPRYRLLLVYNAQTSVPTILRVLRTDRDLGPILTEMLGDFDETG